MNSIFHRRFAVFAATSLILAGLLVLCVFGLPRVAAGQQGRDPSTDLDLILLLDNSASMESTDPNALRVQAARFLVDYLQANSQAVESNYRMGIISFGGELGYVLPLGPLVDGTIRDGIQAEKLPFTDFKMPLAEALKEFSDKSSGDRSKAVILFTDGHPQLTDANLNGAELEQYFGDLAPVISQFRDAGASVFVVGIGDAIQDRDNWGELIDQDNYYPLSDTSQLADIYHKIVSGLLGIASSPLNTVEGGETATILIEPYLERVVISLLRSSENISVTLASPSGVVMAPTAGGTVDLLHEIYSIEEPEAGNWLLITEGSGRVAYWVDRQLPTPVVSIDAPLPHPGQPLTITARVLRNGVVISDLLPLQAVVLQPGGDTITATMTIVQPGEYGYVFVPDALGVYSVTVSAALGESLVATQPAGVGIEILPALLLQPTATATASPAPTRPAPTGTAVAKATPQLSLAEQEKRWQIDPPWLFAGIIALVVALTAMITWQHRSRQKYKHELVDLKDRTDTSAALLKEIDEGVTEAREIEDPIASIKACEVLLDKLAVFEQDKAKELAGNPEISELMELLVDRFAEIDELETRVYWLITKKSGAALHALAEYLLVQRWAKNIDQALKEIYGILQQGEGSWRLLLYVENVQPVDDSVAHHLHDLCHALNDVYNLPDQLVRARIVIMTRAILHSLERLGVSVPESKEVPCGWKLYDYLVRLSSQLEGDAFPLPDVPKLENCIPVWKSTLYECNNLFDISHGFVEWQKQLRAFGSGEEKPKYTPEGRLLMSLVRRWEERTTQIDPRPAKLEILLAPNLTLDPVLRNTTNLPVAIRNSGGDAFQLLVRLESSQQQLGSAKLERIAADQITPVNVSMNLSAVILNNGEGIETGSTRIDVAVDCFDLTDSRKSFSDSFTFSTKMAVSGSVAKVRNPYVVGKALGPNDLFVDREEIINSLRAILNDDEQNSGIINLHGLPGVGKTSLIYRLIDDLEGRGSSSAVVLYINCVRFEHLPSSSSWTSHDFFRTLQRTIRNRLLERELISESVGEDLKEITDFTDFVRMVLSQPKCKRLVLVLDDADVFFVERNGIPLFPDFGETIWRRFKIAINDYDVSRGTDNSGFFIFFAAGMNVSRTAHEGEPDQLGNRDFRIGFLSKDAARRLTMLHSETLQPILSYDDLAFEYYWRVTGGHPTVSQLVCSHVIREWEKGHKPQVIPLEIVKTAVRELFSSSDVKAYLRHPYYYSLDDEQRRTLEMLCGEDVLNRCTLNIDMDQLQEPVSQATLNYLQTKEFLTRGNDGQSGKPPRGTYYLRTGFVKFLIEQWPMT